MKWALVLSGGGGNGLAHVGVIKELERLKLKPSLIVGTSMGAVIGGVYASGKSIEWIEEFVTNKLKIHDMVTTMPTLKWGEGPLVRVFQAGNAIKNLMQNLGAESGEKILEIIKEITEDINIEDTVIPFATNAVDLLTGDEKVFSSGNLADAIRSSMSIPPFFEPYKLEDALYVDGAFADNMPVNIARDMGFRKILSVDVSPPRPLESDKIKNSLEATWRAMSISIKNSHRPVKATVHIEAYKGAYNFDFEHADELIDVGRQAVIDNELKIKRAFYSWYHRI